MDQLIRSLMDIAGRLLDGRATWSEFRSAALRQSAISGTVHHMPQRDPDSRVETALTTLAEAAAAAFLREGGTLKQVSGLQRILFEVGKNVAMGKFGAPFFDGIGKARS